MTTIAHYDDTLHRAQVIALWKDVFGYDTPHNEPGLVIDRKVAVRDDLFFVALAEQTLVGTVLAGYDGHRGWLYSVAVDPSHRRMGVGKALVAHAELSLIAMGCPKINLQIIADNERVVAFYGMLGYDVEPRLSMGKRIR